MKQVAVFSDNDKRGNQKKPMSEELTRRVKELQDFKGER